MRCVSRYGQVKGYRAWMRRPCFNRRIWIRLGCSADGIADHGIADDAADPKSNKYVAATRVNWR
jgi:hypothetical protein